MWIPIVLTIVVLFLLSVFLFPEAYLELYKRILRSARKDYARRNGYQKMMEKLGPYEWWEYQTKPDEVENK